ncbi:CoA transferase [Tsukamurella tyrosinosolvens]|uniref:CoA transferase n=1 Tax=Tsukamurella tyrosinosolvens TaxID=57704 RepID=UPI000C7F6139|nr:CoA transferase [Tsukamurella tyrosinosolvens]AUN41839.1 hypothetical protein ASU32_19025 [Tsukamurella tyrosinosolvens]
MTMSPAAMEVFAALGIADDSFAAPVRIHGQDPVVSSPHRIGDASAASLAALGAEMAALWHSRGGPAQSVDVSIFSAITQLTGSFYTKVNGVSIFDLAEDRNLFSNTGFYRSSTGRFVHLVLTYPHLRDIICRVLGCPPAAESLQAAVGQWDPFELEEAIAAAGGSAAVVRTQGEWRSHPQGRILASTPLVSTELIRTGLPKSRSQKSPPPKTPMAGIRVLDNTHVIAGPIATRTMAEHGADVLHTSVPTRPDPNPMVIDTSIGKRSAFCDLTDPGQVKKFWELLGETDVFVNSYLGLEAKGFSSNALAARTDGIVILDFRSWGLTGPWSQRKGFDQPVCAATGIAVEQGSEQSPALPVTHLLNDYLAAILGAAGAAEALRRRDEAGGSYHVHVDLARISMWVQDLGLIPAEQITLLPRPSLTRSPIPLTVSTGPWGTTEYLPSQIGYSDYSTGATLPSQPLGAADLTWW